MPFKQEHLGGGICAFTSREHGFGHDALLLSDFAAPKPREAACDLGCGCGIIPLVWFARGGAPGAAYGVDIRPQAIEQFTLGVRESRLGDRCFPVCGDLREFGRGKSPAFGLVTCNPPYYSDGGGKISGMVAERIARHEGPHSCTFTEVCAAAARLLKNAGRFCICHKPERLPELFEELRRHRLEPKRLRLAHQNAQAPAWLALIEARLSAKPGMVVEPPYFTESP